MEKVGLIAIFNTDNFSKGLDSYLKGVNSANNAAKNAEDQSFSLTRALEVFVGNALVEVGKLALDAAGKMVDFGKDSIAIAANFQDALIDLKLAASDSELSIDELGDVAIAVGNDSRILGASASGAADAMTTLFKAGLEESAVLANLNGFMEDGDRLTGALASSFDLAAASSLDVAQAAEFGANLLAVFGGEAKTGAERADFLANAFNFVSQAAAAGTSDVDTLQEGLSYFGPTAAAAGLSLEDTVNSLNLLEKAGINGSRAGTTMEAVLRDLQKTTPKATKAMNEMGIQLFDNSGGMLPFIDIMGQLEDATKSMTDEQRSQALGAVFQSQAMRGINVLVNEGIDGWNGMLDATANAATLQEQAAEKSQSYSQQVEALNGVIETFQIQVGTALLPILTKLTQFFTGLAEKYGPMVADVFGKIAEGVMQFVEVLLNGGSIFDAFGQAIDDNMSDKAMTKMWVNIGKVKEVFDDTWSFVKDSVIPVIMDTGQWIGENLPKALDFASKTWENVLLPALQNFWDFTEKKVLPVVEDVWIWLKDNLPSAIERVTDFWENVLLPVLQIVWDFITNVLLPGFQGLWDFLEFTLGPVIDWLADLFFNTLLPALQDVETFLRENVLPIVLDVANAFNEKMAKGLSAIADLWEKTLKPGLRDMGDYLSKTFGPIIDDMGDNITAFKDGFNELAEAIGKIDLGAVFEGVADTIKGSINEALGSLEDGLNSVIDTINEFIKAINILATAVGLKGLPLIPNIDIPELALGGVINKATLALLGESGPEAVVPLPDMARFLQQAVSMINPPTMQNSTRNENNTFNNQRDISINIQTNNAPQGGTDIFYDVVAALQAVGV